MEQPQSHGAPLLGQSGHSDAAPPPYTAPGAAPQYVVVMQPPQPGTYAQQPVYVQQPYGQPMVYAPPQQQQQQPQPYVQPYAQQYVQSQQPQSGQLYVVPPQQYTQPPAPAPQPVKAGAKAAHHHPAGQTVPHPGADAAAVNAGPRFADPEGCRDTFWAVLFVAHLIAMIALCIYFYIKLEGEPKNCDSNNSGGSGGSGGGSGGCPDWNVKLTGDMWSLLVMFCAVGGVVSALWLWAIKRAAASMIWFTLLFTPVLWGAFGLCFFAFGFVIPGVIMILMALLSLLYAYLVRRRVPFAAAMLETVVEVIRAYPHTVSVAMASIVAQVAWVIVWVMGATSILQSMMNSNESDGTRVLVYFFLLISFYWTGQVIKNVVHVTVAGTFATWYFMAPNAMPDSPTLKAFKRASWRSLGSIALGSLIIAVLKALRQMAEMGRRNRNGFVRCCVICIISCLERMVAYFNHYAFTQIAIYGKPYCEAAKDTWQLLCARGFDMLINDNLIGGVLTLGMFVVALVTGCVAVIFAYKVWAFDAWVLWVVIGCCVGAVIALCAMEVVDSCVAACFVCFAEDPHALQATKPEVYTKLSNAFNQRLAVLRRVRANQQQNQQNQR